MLLSAGALLLLSPLLGWFLGVALLIGLALLHEMRPPKPSPITRRLALLSRLQTLCRINLAQHDGDRRQPYSRRNFRDIIGALENVKNGLQKQESQRYRLLHLANRWEARYRRLRTKRRQEQYRPSRSFFNAARRLAKQWRKKPGVKKQRPFNPYAKPRRPFSQTHENLEILTNPTPAHGHWSIAVKEKEIPLEEYQELLELPLVGMEFSVKTELELNLGVVSSILCDGAQRLRLILAGTGVVLPSVTFWGDSNRLKSTVGLLIKGVEVGDFHLQKVDFVSLPSNWNWPRSRRVERTNCLPAEQGGFWPLPTLTPVQHVLLRLTQLSSQNLSSLLQREWLLRDLVEPTLPSHQIQELAVNYLESGRPIPRTRFLEMSLQLFNGLQEKAFSLPVEQKDLPSHISVSTNPLPVYQRLEVVELTLTLLGDLDNRNRQKVEARLSGELRDRLAGQLPHLGARKSRDFESIITTLSQSEEAQATFGPSQYLRTTGFLLVERLLASEPPCRSLTPELAHLACKKSVRNDPNWCALSIALSFLEERSTVTKLRRLAKQDAARLARLLERFATEEIPPHRTPLEKLSILCAALGPEGETLQHALKIYFPALPTVAYSPRNAYDVQLEFLARVRAWAVRGLQHSLGEGDRSSLLN